MANAVLERQGVLTAMRQLKVAARRKRNVKTWCEVTITDGKVTLAVPGIQIDVKAETQGAGRFNTLLLYLEDIVAHHFEKEMRLTIRKGEVKLGGVVFMTETIFFGDDRILRTIDLPINYTDADLIALIYNENYTIEEIQFNKIEKQVEAAQLRLSKKITKAAELLESYGDFKEGIWKLVYERIDPEWKIRKNEGMK